MSQPNRNRRWIFERDMYAGDCVKLRPEVAQRAHIPLIVQYELFPKADECGNVLTHQLTEVTQ